MKTTKFVPKEKVVRNWVLVDAKDMVLGRLASQVAQILRGKDRADFTPNADHGDFVVVINAKHIRLTGNKWTEKKYYRHSRFFGSLKEFSARQMWERDPAFLVREAVRGMLPKNKLSYRLINKLKVYSEGEHPHRAQKPQPKSLRGA